MTATKAPKLGLKRQAFQWATSLTILLLPFLHWNGHSLLRIDLGTLTLYLFGQTLHIDELFLALLFTLVMGLAFLLITMVFGRVWCGWACPQTTLSDVAEWLSRKLGLKIIGNRLSGPLFRRLLAHLAYILLALLVGANLVWYFIEPQRFFLQLLHNQLQLGAWIIWIGIALVIYLDFALVRRVMCHDFCPYGRFQTALADTGTLTLHLPESEAPRCIKCGACVRCCPMGIDIRQGFQVECINCGRCLDACRKVMAARQQPGLIRYSFGVEGKGVRALLNPRTLLLSAALLVLSVAFFSAIYLKPVASLKISLSHTAGSRVLQNNTQVTFFTAWVGNRGQSDNRYHLEARLGESGTQVMLRGQTRDIELAPGGNREIQFVVTSAVIHTPQEVVFALLDEQQTRLATATALLSPP